MLPRDQKRQFNQALKVNGIDQEIALLRVILNSLLIEYEKNLPSIMEVVKTVGRLSYIKSVQRQDFTQLKEAVAAVLSQWEIPVPTEKDTASSSDAKNHEH